jgi:uncharacterized RDD family membrane protein YckC
MRVNFTTQKNQDGGAPFNGWQNRGEKRAQQPGFGGQTQFGECPRCGALLETGASACGFCGANFAGADLAAATPSLKRRLSAELFDRLLPFAFWAVLALPLLPVGLRHWFAVTLCAVFAWHLLRDCSPRQRSWGKGRFGLRVVAANGARRCAWPRLILRRSLAAVAQVAYWLALAYGVGLVTEIAKAWPEAALVGRVAKELMVGAVCYDLISLATLLISSQARRLEDYLAGTRVVVEAEYQQTQRRCTGCGAAIPPSAERCDNCRAQKEPSWRPMAAD